MKKSDKVKELVNRNKDRRIKSLELIGNMHTELIKVMNESKDTPLYNAYITKLVCDAYEIYQQVMIINCDIEYQTETNYKNWSKS